jgi:vitamin B12 transporter
MRAHLRVSRDALEGLELQALLSVSEVDAGSDDKPDDASDTDGFVSLDHFRRSSGEVRANLSVGTAVVTLGGELEEERFRSFSEAAGSFGTSYGRSENERLNKAVFLHATGERGVLSLNVGARLEDNERFGRGFTWQSGLSAYVPGRPGTRLRASVGTAIKEPSFFENFATGFVNGNPGLDPERSRSWEVGIQQEILGRGSLQVTYFDQALEDLIQFTFAPPNPGDPNYFNVAGAASRGVEIDASARWGGVTVGASYTWLDTEVTDAGFANGPGAELVQGENLLRRPTHTLALRSSGEIHSRARLHSSLSFVGSSADRSFDPVTFSPTRQELPSHALWTLGGEWDVLKPGGRQPSVSLSMRADNLLDQAYEEVWGFSAPGRQLYVGLSVGFGGD